MESQAVVARVLNSIGLLYSFAYEILLKPRSAGSASVLSAETGVHVGSAGKQRP